MNLEVIENKKECIHKVLLLMKEKYLKSLDKNEYYGLCFILKSCIVDNDIYSKEVVSLMNNYMYSNLPVTDKVKKNYHDYYPDTDINNTCNNTYRVFMHISCHTWDVLNSEPRIEWLDNHIELTK